jgi:hypothetical protein
MKLNILSSLTLFLLVSGVYATSNISDIQLSFVKGNYLVLTGTAVGSVHNFSFDEIENNTVSLGTLGLSSSSSANCTVKFSSVNGYKLRHTVSNNVLTNYTVKYKNTDFSNPWWTPTLYTSCNTADSIVEMTVSSLPSSSESGIYRDIITVTIATQ